MFLFLLIWIDEDAEFDRLRLVEDMFLFVSRGARMNMGVSAMPLPALVHLSIHLPTPCVASHTFCTLVAVSADHVLLAPQACDPGGYGLEWPGRVTRRLSDCPTRAAYKSAV